MPKKFKPKNKNQLAAQLVRQLVKSMSQKEAIAKAADYYGADDDKIRDILEGKEEKQ